MHLAPTSVYGLLAAQYYQRSPTGLSHVGFAYGPLCDSQLFNRVGLYYCTRESEIHGASMCTLPSLEKLSAFLVTSFSHPASRYSRLMMPDVGFI